MSRNSLPGVTELRKRLGQYEPGTRKRPGWYRAARTFRENYIDHNGLSGRLFCRWGDPDHRRGLIDMTHEFLETEGNGRGFWPSNGTAPSGLDYSNDSALYVE